MVKFIEGLKQGLGISFVLGLFIFGLYMVKGWTGTDGLTAQTGDTLTAEKWNALNAKVDNISASNGGWEEVSLTGTTDFDMNCDRKVLRQDVPQVHIINTISPTKAYFILDNSNNWYYVYSNSRNLFRYEGSGVTYPISKIWKSCN